MPSHIGDVKKTIRRENASTHNQTYYKELKVQFETSFIVIIGQVRQGSKGPINGR